MDDWWIKLGSKYKKKSVHCHTWIYLALEFFVEPRVNLFVRPAGQCAPRTHLCLPSCCWDRSVSCHTRHFTCALEIKLRFSCLCKRFANWGVSLTPEALTCWKAKAVVLNPWVLTPGFGKGVRGGGGRGVVEWPFHRHLLRLPLENRNLH